MLRRTTEARTIGEVAYPKKPVQNPQSKRGKENPASDGGEGKKGGGKGRRYRGKRKGDSPKGGDEGKRPRGDKVTDFISTHGGIKQGQNLREKELKHRYLIRGPWEILKKKQQSLRIHEERENFITGLCGLKKM